jgi:large subunit ribosomal protein L25
MRTQGIVPGVYYSKSDAPVHVAIPALSLRPVVYTSKARMISLEIEGGKTVNCVLQDVTFDPITDAITHVDFLGVKPGEKIVVGMPLHLEGTAEGVKRGGALDHTIHRVHARVDPHTMPEHLVVDITHLNIGGAIHVGDIKIEGVEIIDRAENVIVSCYQPRVSAAQQGGDKK